VLAGCKLDIFFQQPTLTNIVVEFHYICTKLNYWSHLSQESLNTDLGRAALPQDHRLVLEGKCYTLLSSHIQNRNDRWCGCQCFGGGSREVSVTAVVAEGCSSKVGVSKVAKGAWVLVVRQEDMNLIGFKPIDQNKIPIRSQHCLQFLWTLFDSPASQSSLARDYPGWHFSAVLAHSWYGQRHEHFKCTEPAKILFCT